MGQHVKQPHHVKAKATTPQFPEMTRPSLFESVFFFSASSTLNLSSVLLTLFPVTMGPQSACPASACVGSSKCSVPQHRDVSLSCQSQSVPQCSFYKILLPLRIIHELVIDCPSSTVSSVPYEHNHLSRNDSSFCYDFSVALLLRPLRITHIHNTPRPCSINLLSSSLHVCRLHTVPNTLFFPQVVFSQRGF